MIPDPPVDLVRIRAGSLAGREGRFVGAIGPRRFTGGVQLEAGIVHLPDGTTRRGPAGRPGALHLTGRVASAGR